MLRKFQSSNVPFVSSPSFQEVEVVTLYHAAGSRSCRVRWVLEELGVPYRIERLTFGDGSMQSPAYLAKNPAGKVPTLEDDGTVLFESGAICEYLVERYGKGRLAPAPGAPGRAAYLQWLHWGEASLTPPLGELVAQKFMRPEAERLPQVEGDARKRLRKSLDLLEQALAKGDYLLGAELSAADCVVAYALQLAKLIGELPGDLPRIAAYHARCAARPAFQKAFAD